MPGISAVLKPLGRALRPEVLPATQAMILGIGFRRRANTMYMRLPQPKGIKSHRTKLENVYTGELETS